MSTTAIMPDEDPKRAILRVTLTYQSCLLSVMVYDYLACLRLEYQYIWKSRSLVTVLYFILRYWELLRESLTLYLATVEYTPEQCRPFGQFQVYSTLPVTAAVATLFALRLHALYDRNKILLAILALGISIMLIVNGIAGREFAPLEFSEGTGPCFAGAKLGASNMVICLWLTPFIYDLLTTAMLVFRVVVLRRRGASSGGILQVLVRDGVLFFTIISIANLINVGFFLGAPPSYAAINASMAYCVTSVAASRLILSLRQHGAAVTAASSDAYTEHGQTFAKAHAAGHGISRIRVQVPDAERGGMHAQARNDEQGMQTHIALDTFGSTHVADSDQHSDRDSEGKGGHNGVFVIRETHFRVDEEKQ